MEHPLLDKITKPYGVGNAYFRSPQNTNRGNVFVVSPTDLSSGSSIIGSFNHDCCEFMGDFNQNARKLSDVYPFFYPKEIGLQTVEACNHYHENWIKPYLKFLNELGMPIVDLGVQFLDPTSLTIHRDECIPVFMFRMEADKFVNKPHALASFTCLRYLWFDIFRDIPRKVLEYQKLFNKMNLHNNMNLQVTPSYIMGLAHWGNNGLGLGKSLFSSYPYLLRFSDVITKNAFVNLCSQSRRIQSIFNNQSNYQKLPIDTLFTSDFKQRLRHLSIHSSSITTLRKSTEYNSYNGVLALSGISRDNIRRRLHDLHIELIGSIHANENSLIIQRKMMEISSFGGSFLEKNKL